MLGMGVIQQHLVGLYKGLGVFDFTGGGDRMKVSRCHLLHDFAARRHFGEVSRPRRRSGSPPPPNHRSRKKNLAEMKLPLGERVTGNKGETTCGNASGKDLGKFADEAGAEPLGREIVLIKAGVGSEGNGGQELLEGLELLGLYRLLGVLGL